MDYAAVSIAILNLALVLTRAWRSLFKRRLIAIVWLLVAYFSFFLVGLALEGEYKHYRGFTGDLLTVRSETIRYICVYVFSCNLLLALSEMLTWKLFGLKSSQISWKLSARDSRIRIANWIFLTLLLAGAVFYWLTMQGSDYRAYVESKSSNWPVVFFWASSPFITLAILQRKYWQGGLAITPFLFFAFYLDIRSFALLSLIPAAIVFYFQLLEKTSRRKTLPILAKGFVIACVLIGASAVVMHKKSIDMDLRNTGGLPDSGMVYGMGMAFEMTKRIKEYTEFNSLTKYALNTINPFLRLFGVPLPVIKDTPVHIAGLIDGVPSDWPVYFHYPTLWYTDAFVSFGGGGVLLAVFWGVLLSLWERLMLRRTILIALFLPFYTWHAYMLIRGATAVATVPFSYSIYVVIIVAAMSGQFFRVRVNKAVAKPA